MLTLTDILIRLNNTTQKHLIDKKTTVMEIEKLNKIIDELREQKTELQDAIIFNNTELVKLRENNDSLKNENDWLKDRIEHLTIEMNNKSKF